MNQQELNVFVANRLAADMKNWDKNSLSSFLSSFTSKVQLNSVKDFLKFVRTNDEDDIADMLDSALDELASNDAFGSEQQCDPRGDFRNGDWSMWDVEDDN